MQLARLARVLAVLRAQRLDDGARHHAMAPHVGRAPAWPAPPPGSDGRGAPRRTSARSSRPRIAPAAACPDAASRERTTRADSRATARRGQRRQQRTDDRETQPRPASSLQRVVASGHRRLPDSTANPSPPQQPRLQTGHAVGDHQVLRVIGTDLPALAERAQRRDQLQRSRAARGEIRRAHSLEQSAR